MTPQEKRRKNNRARERQNVRARQELAHAGVRRAPHQGTRGAVTAFCAELDRIPVSRWGAPTVHT